MNNDLFGLFVVPLAGIDWRINEHNNLFGILPGNLTYEHQLTRRFYTGLTFRSQTNSYARDTGYWRIDENQFGGYLDYYLTRNLVLTAETGHSILRKIRTGIGKSPKENWDAGNNLCFRLGIAFRIRFKQQKE